MMALGDTQLTHQHVFGGGDGWAILELRHGILCMSNRLVLWRGGVEGNTGWATGFVITCRN
jgi:hypothetical protein